MILLFSQMTKRFIFALVCLAPLRPALKAADKPANALKPGLYAVFDTSEGVITAELFEKYTPIAVANFVGLAQGTKPWRDPKTKQFVRRPMYDGLTFHRVIPEFMKARELAYDEADEIVTVVTLRERKLLMESRADAFVALPGGFGTLEEMMEILTLRQLNVVRKPCVFFNQDGFYDDLLRFFRRMLDEKFFKESNWNVFSVATTIP